MLKYTVLLAFCFSTLSAFSQNEKVTSLIIVDEVVGEDCFENLNGLEAYLFKDDVNNLNNSAHLDYGLKIKKVEKVYPYLVKEGPDGKYIAYDQMVPLLLEALEHTSRLIETENGKRLRLEEEYSNYKIYMENNLQQINYQLQTLQSEINGLNESMSVE